MLRRVDPDAWPDLSDAGLLNGFTGWLGPELFGLRRLNEVAGLDLQAILLRRLDHAQRQALDRLAPAQLAVPSGRRLAVDYTADPPVLAVKLQELFGLAATPTVHGGRTPLALQLLSPAQRPIAVTRDLAGFWARATPRCARSCAAATRSTPGRRTRSRRRRHSGRAQAAPTVG